MEDTIFLRKYINLFRYDKPYNSIPFLLLVVLALVSISNICLAAQTEKNIEISMEALKDAFTVLLIFLCAIEHSLSPDRALALVELIEDDFLVNEEDFVGRGEKWKKIGMLHEKKRKDMKNKFYYSTITQLCLCFGIFFKNYLNYVLGIRAYLDEDPKRWPTPFLYVQPEIQSSSFLLYVCSLHALTLATISPEGHVMFTTVCVSTERVLADFETLYLLLDNFADDFPGENDSESKTQLIVEESDVACKSKEACLKQDMRRIVKCHQNINRNLKICANNSAFVVSAAIIVIVADSCTNAFFMLKTDQLKKAVPSITMFIIENIILFFLYQNGQRIFNQNDILRKYLAELSWTDKPLWFRKTMHIIMTRANVDLEMRPYGIFVLTYMSFKDVMKLTFSVGNVLYSMKVANQS